MSKVLDVHARKPDVEAFNSYVSTKEYTLTAINGTPGVGQFRSNNGGNCTLYNDGSAVCSMEVKEL